MDEERRAWVEDVSGECGLRVYEYVLDEFTVFAAKQKVAVLKGRAVVFWLLGYVEAVRRMKEMLPDVPDDVLSAVLSWPE